MIPDEELCGAWMSQKEDFCLERKGHTGGHRMDGLNIKRADRSGPKSGARKIEALKRPNRDHCGARVGERRDRCFLSPGHIGGHRTKNYNHTLNGKASSLFCGARKRAREKDIPFDLTPEWVREELESAIANGCPYLGIPIRLDGGLNDPSSPSVDQFYPGAGYTKANCIVVSWMANRMKSNAQPLVVEKLGQGVAQLRVTRFQRPESVDVDDTHDVA